MLRGICVGDLHLGKKRLHDLFGDRVVDLQLAEVRKVLDYALSNEIPYVFFLGDASDEPSLPDLEETELLRLLFEYDGRLTIYFILGNHDIEQKHVNSLCKIELLYRQGIFRSIHVMPGHEVITLEGVTCEFMSYPHHEPKKTNSLCFAHIERPGAIRDNGMRIPDDSGHPEPDTNNFWFIGHLHTPHIVGNSVYVGTQFQTSFGEQPNKTFTHFKARMNGRKLEVKHQQVTQNQDFMLHNLTPSSFEELNISANLLHKYRILYPHGIDMPSNFLLKHPNVVECRSYKDKTELKELLQPELIAYEITDGLQHFLKERGLGNKYNKARRVVNRALSSLTNT